METMPLILKEVLSESLVHTATMLPVLFLAFIIVEFVHIVPERLAPPGNGSPLLGTSGSGRLGTLPQRFFGGHYLSVLGGHDTNRLTPRVIYRDV